MPLSLARQLANALGQRSETVVREIDAVMTAYVRDTPQAGGTVIPGTIGWNNVTGKPATFDPLSVATIDTTTHTITTEDVLLADDDTAGGAQTFTLPAASGVNYPIWVKKLGTTANVIIDGDDAETIDGAATLTLTTQYESVMICSDGNNWHVLATG